MNIRKTQDQNRAEHAYVQVKDEKDKEYGSLVRSLPAMIQANGLGQTLAFLMAKGENNPAKAHFRLYHHLSYWLGKAIQNQENQRDFLPWLVQQSTPVYRRAMTEALAYAMWLRRFAEAKGLTEIAQRGAPTDSVPATEAAAIEGGT